MEIKKVKSFDKKNIYFEDGSEMYMPFGLDTALTLQEVQGKYEYALQVIRGSKIIGEKYKNT